MNERYLARLDELIALGEATLATQVEEGTGNNRNTYVDYALFSEWVPGTKAFLLHVFGEDHPLYADFKQHGQFRYAGTVVHGLGMLKAARAHIAGGFLATTTELAYADVFASMIGTAQHYFDARHVDAAVWAAGGVLEEGLRRLAAKYNVTPGDDISATADRLVGKHINRLERSEIGRWKGLRDLPDHGKFGQIQPEQAQQMIDGVRTFLAHHIGQVP